MTRQRFSARNQRGQSIVLVAVTMVGLLAMMALAIDLSVMFKTRVEAQRAADAASLAGASVFLEPTTPTSVDSAHARARVLADTNYMQGGKIDVSTCTKNGDEYLCPEMTVHVLPDSFKVRVWIYRRQVGTFFARVLHIFNMPIGAMAAAEASQAGTGTCVKPFLIPDYWDDNTGEDLNSNTLWDLPPTPPKGQYKCGVGGVECWGFTSGSDGYYQYNDTTTTSSEWTGLYSDFRNASTDWNGHRYKQDIGRQVVMYPESPQYSPTPSNYYLWRITCPGGNCVRDALTGCVTLKTFIGEIIANEQPGGQQGPVSQGLNDWMNQDQSARWVEYTNGDGYQEGQVVSNVPGMSGLSNPRVFIAALMRPEYLNPGYDEVPVMNLARFFLESGPTSPGDKAPIVVRFLGFASGIGPDDPDLGTLVKVLRLVE